ncbi:unnamed protein product, partial [Meganyctiphanes norvegica]
MTLKNLGLKGLIKRPLPLYSDNDKISYAESFRYCNSQISSLITDLMTLSPFIKSALAILWKGTLGCCNGYGKSLYNLIVRPKNETVNQDTSSSRDLRLQYILSEYSYSLGLWKVVQRTKQCLDFTVTAHFLHLIGSWFYNGHLPSQPSVWLLNLVTITLMCVLGEYLCMRTEMQNIPVMSSKVADL